MREFVLKSQNEKGFKKKKRLKIFSLFNLVGVVRLELTLPEGTRF